MGIISTISNLFSSAKSSAKKVVGKTKGEFSSAAKTEAMTMSKVNTAQSQSNTHEDLKQKHAIHQVLPHSKKISFNYNTDKQQITNTDKKLLEDIKKDISSIEKNQTVNQTGQFKSIINRIVAHHRKQYKHLTAQPDLSSSGKTQRTALTEKQAADSIANYTKESLALIERSHLLITEALKEKVTDFDGKITLLEFNKELSCRLAKEAKQTVTELVRNSSAKFEYRDTIDKTLTNSVKDLFKLELISKFGFLHKDLWTCLFPDNTTGVLSLLEREGSSLKLIEEIQSGEYQKYAGEFKRLNKILSATQGSVFKTNKSNNLRLFDIREKVPKALETFRRFLIESTVGELTIKRKLLSGESSDISEQSAELMLRDSAEDMKKLFTKIKDLQTTMKTKVTQLQASMKSNSLFANYDVDDMVKKIIDFDHRKLNQKDNQTESRRNIFSLEPHIFGDYNSVSISNSFKSTHNKIFEKLVIEALLYAALNEYSMDLINKPEEIFDKLEKNNRNSNTPWLKELFLKKRNHYREIKASNSNLVAHKYIQNDINYFMNELGKLPSTSAEGCNLKEFYKDFQLSNYRKEINKSLAEETQSGLWSSSIKVLIDLARMSGSNMFRDLGSDANRIAIDLIQAADIPIKSLKNEKDIPEITQKASLRIVEYLKGNDGANFNDATETLINSLDTFLKKSAAKEDEFNRETLVLLTNLLYTVVKYAPRELTSIENMSTKMHLFTTVTKLIDHPYFTDKSDDIEHSMAARSLLSKTVNKLFGSGANDTGKANKLIREIESKLTSGNTKHLKTYLQMHKSMELSLANLIDAIDPLAQKSLENAQIHSMEDILPSLINKLNTDSKQTKEEIFSFLTTYPEAQDIPQVDKQNLLKTFRRVLINKSQELGSSLVNEGKFVLQNSDKYSVEALEELFVNLYMLEKMTPGLITKARYPQVADLVEYAKMPIEYVKTSEGAFQGFNRIKNQISAIRDDIFPVSITREALAA